MRARGHAAHCPSLPLQACHRVDIFLVAASPVSTPDIVQWTRGTTEKMLPVARRCGCPSTASSARTPQRSCSSLQLRYPSRCPPSAAPQCRSSHRSVL
eukprot:3696147-Rhodomonas_salina.2